jgi:catechol 2,3-dioxygenase-like lactoylglutathione lyase family enzyme
MMKLAKDSLDVGVYVSDIKASLDFYRNTLGLEFAEEIELPIGTMHRLKCGTSDFKLVDPEKAPPKGPSGMRDQLGFRYVTFVVGNLSELCRGLEEKGVEFFMPETEIRPGVRIAMVKDPDDNTVEFVERSS